MIEKLKDKYNIIRKIGQGGMAIIYLATDKKTNEKVAIKLLEPSSENDVIKRKRFEQEIEILKKIDSKYVAKMYDAEMTKEYSYIAMEYVDGHILKNYIQKYSRLTVDEAIEFTKQLALGFYEIHKKGIIHRDIKSPNVMVGTSKEIKIIDFGIALGEETERVTRTNMLIGSPQYVSPELIAQEQPTKQSDIYALGVLLYEMLTGDVPFTGKDALATLKKHQHSEIPKITKHFPNVPKSIENIITKATAKKAHQRYNDMYDMYKDLDRCLSKEASNDATLILGQGKKRDMTTFINSKYTLAIIIFLLLAITISLIIVFAIKGS